MISGKRITIGTLAGLVLLCAVVPVFAAESEPSPVIFGASQVVTVPILQVLDSTDPNHGLYYQCFNMGFTLQAFFGVFGVALKCVINVIPKPWY